jgi:predicted permease
MRARDLLLRLRSVLVHGRLERELTDELQFHLEMQARKHVAAGLEPAEARRRARAEFGSVELAKEDARDARGIRLVEEFAQDARFALRGFRRSPLFALTVVCTIGLGLGLNASVFTIFNAYVLQPLAVRDPRSLYDLYWVDRKGEYHDNFRRSEYAELGRENGDFSGVVASQPLTVRLEGRVSFGNVVSDNYFRMLGVEPALGRTLSPEELSAGSSPAVLVLSHEAWQRRFGGDSGVVGRRVLVRGSSFEIVGVARAGFAGLQKKPSDFWAPLEALAQLEDSSSLTAGGDPEHLRLLGRLNAGTSGARAASFLTGRLRVLTADRAPDERAIGAGLTPRTTAVRFSASTLIGVVPIAIAFLLVLMIACANVANMMLARGVARQREIGIRLSLGAARGRLIRQLLTESVLLSLPAAAVGYAISRFALDGGVRLMMATLPAGLAPYVRLMPLHPDLRMLAFMLAAALLAALLFGLAPALQATRPSVVQASRGNFDTEHRPARMRNVLVVGQVTVAVLFLTCAGVIFGGTRRLVAVDPGLRTRDVLSLEIRERSRARALTRLAGNPLVAAFAATSVLPLDMRPPNIPASAGDGHPVAGVSYAIVSASYFRVLDIAVVRGRNFLPSEERDGAPVVIVSARAAQRLWPGLDPLGRRMRLSLDAAGEQRPRLFRYQDARVVGVVPDVVSHAVTDPENRALVYFPASVETPGCCLLIRTSGNPELAARAIDADIERAEPGAVERIDALEAFVAGAVYPFRAASWVSLALGAIALLLTLAGIFGVVSYVVTERTREMGIRMALGAGAWDVVGLVIGQALRLAGLGIAIGAVLALGVSQLLAANVEAMRAFDPVAFAGAAIFALAACALAAYVPSRRAARIDPMTTLRRD